MLQLNNILIEKNTWLNWEYKRLNYHLWYKKHSQTWFFIEKWYHVTLL